MVPDMHCHTWQEIATEDKTCSRNLGPLSKLLVLRQGDLADTPVSGWLFADSITVMQMMIVILCISSQVINITHALSIQDIKSPKVSIGQRWIWKTVCLEESQTQGILLHQNMLGANKAWHIYGVYISIVTASYLSCIFLIHIWHIYIYIYIYTQPCISMENCHSGRVYWWLRNLSQLAGMERNPLQGPFPLELPHPHGLGPRVLRCWSSATAALLTWVTGTRMVLKEIYS